MISLCPNCNQSPRTINTRPEQIVIDRYGEPVLDYGMIMICGCDPRWKDAQQWKILEHGD